MGDLMGLLGQGPVDDGLGAGSGVDLSSLPPWLISAMMQNVNPMQRPIAGEEYLAGLGQMPMPEQQMMPGQIPGEVPQQVPQQVPQGIPEMGAPGGAEGVPLFSTDFNGTTPGLPNLSDNYKGFGYGQTAPREMQNPLSVEQGKGRMLREQLINKLLQGGIV